MSTDTIVARVQTAEKGFSSQRSDLLAIEEPLQFCLNGSPISITMRTPGSDLDLAVGFLFTGGIINDVHQILSMRSESGEDISGTSGDKVTIRLRPEIAIDPGRIRRDSYTSSSCGVCGKLAVGAMDVRPARPMRSAAALASGAGTRSRSTLPPSALVKRSMAAMINTSSSVKPRVVIFHMTASQLVRSIAPLCKARGVPNAVAHISDGKARGLVESRLARQC
jgi:hypothetical protein